jgi:hypothetical protein
MKLLFLIFVAIAAFCASECKAQSATASVQNSKSLQYTVSNSSGFSIKNNGSLGYKGPLNALSQSSEDLPTAVMRVNNSSYSTPDDLVESTINKNNNTNNLSPKLAEATIPASKRHRKITLSYSSTVPSVISIKLKETFESREVVDSQSLSIFPSAFPSSF